MEHPDSAQQLSANTYDIYHCCVYSEKPLMMDGETVRNMYSFIPKNIFEKAVNLVGFILRKEYLLVFLSDQVTRATCFDCRVANLRPLHHIQL